MFDTGCSSFPFFHFPLCDSGLFRCLREKVTLQVGIAFTFLSHCSLVVFSWMVLGENLLHTLQLVTLFSIFFFVIQIDKTMEII